MKPNLFTSKLYAVLVAAGLSFTSLTVSAQVKIGASPTVIGPNSNLEVEASTANRKMTVDKTTGQVTIKDGTEGNGYVLTSDPSGNAHWQSLSLSKVPTVVFIGGTSATIVLSSAAAGGIPTRVPLNPVAAYAANWNAASRAFVVPVAGYYRAEFISKFSITNTNPSGAAIVMRLIGKLGPTDTEIFTADNAGTKTLTETAYYNVGDLIYAHVWYSSTGDAYVFGSNMNITYIP